MLTPPAAKLLVRTLTDLLRVFSFFKAFDTCLDAALRNVSRLGSLNPLSHYPQRALNPRLYVYLHGHTSQDWDHRDPHPQLCQG